MLKITDGVIRHGAYRRVKGASTKAPAQAPAPAPVAVAAEPAPEPVTSEPADDTVQAAE